MTDEEVRRIQDYVQAQQAGMVNLLQRLAEIESPSRDPAATGQLLTVTRADAAAIEAAIRGLQSVNPHTPIYVEGAISRRAGRSARRRVRHCPSGRG
jgi:hypothetical protein